MRLRAKILSGFLILVVMLLVAGVWSIYQLRSIGTSVQKLLDDNYQSIHAGNEMIEALEREDSAVLLLLLGHWKEGRALLSEADQQFQKAQKVALGNLTIAGEEEYVSRAAAAYAAYSTIWRKPIVDTEREGNLRWYNEETHPAFQKAKNAVNELIALNEESLYGTASALKQRTGRAVVPGTVATVAALVFSLVFAYLVNNFMVRPIVQITRGIEEFSRSGGEIRVSVATKDEIGDLARTVRGLCAAAGGSRGR
jgi:methyl-accepting chemotaxis protein